MGYDPNAGTFRPLENEQAIKDFYQQVPKGVLFTEGEELEVKGCTFRVHEVGEQRLILKPVKKT